MKKILNLGVVFTTFMLLHNNAYAQKTAVVTLEGLNIRQQIDKKGVPFAHLQKGTVVTVLNDTNADWWLVEFKFRKKTFKGYVASKNLESQESLLFNEDKNEEVLVLSIKEDIKPEPTIAVQPTQNTLTSPRPNEKMQKIMQAAKASAEASGTEQIVYSNAVNSGDKSLLLKVTPGSEKYDKQLVFLMAKSAQNESKIKELEAGDIALKSKLGAKDKEIEALRKKIEVLDTYPDIKLLEAINKDGKLVNLTDIGVVYSLQKDDDYIFKVPIHLKKTAENAFKKVGKRVFIAKDFVYYIVDKEELITQ